MYSSLPSSKPLRNRRILVACSAKKMFELVAGLEAMGGSILPLSVIEARDIDDKKPMDRAIASLADYAWIIFTSAYGVCFFMQRMTEIKSATQIRSMPRICAIGPATASVLKEFGYEAIMVPKKFVAEGILEALCEYYGGIQHLSGLQILLPRALEAREFLPEALAKAGARVDTIPCYRTVPARPDPEVLQQLYEKKTDLIVFTSSSTVRNLISLLGPDTGRDLLLKSKIAVLGPITASTVEAFGKSAEIIPRENTVSSLLEVIREYYGGHQ